MTTIDLNRPMWQLTVGEFLEVTKGIEQPPVIVDYKEDEFVYGIGGLAKLIGASYATAWNLRKSGKIDKATHQTGRTLIFNKKKVLEILKTK